jgi:hypothetical protein
MCGLVQDDEVESADMHSLLIDVDENVLKVGDAFQKVEDERFRDRCNFRKVCD